MEKACVVCETGNYKDYNFGNGLCEQHNVCILCGIKRKELGCPPWGVRYGAFQCQPCEKIERAARVSSRIKEGFSHDCEDEVICPNCGYEYGDSWEMREGKHDCPECEKSFELEAETSRTYSTKKLELSKA